MREPETLSRRKFLIGSAAFGAGVAFGTYTVAQDSANLQLSEPGSDATTFNPWVTISPDKITLITPHVDLGQGVVSTQAALIAEEMDLEWGQFDTDFGLTDPAYANLGVADEFAPVRSTDRSPEAEALRAAAIAMIKSGGMQVTGGSSSIRDVYKRLRIAGAVARETLKAAAAQRTGVGVADLKTRAGAVILPDGTPIPYVDLAAEAGQINAVENVVLRDRSEWRLLGKPMERLDVEAKSTGALEFGIDKNLEGMVYAAVKLNPYKNGGLKSFDATKAEVMPGVLRVVEITDGIAVVATNTWYAIKAAEAVDCVWGEGAYPAEQADHWAKVESSFTPEHLDKVWRDEGNVESALETADKLIEREYRAPYVAHQPLEPLNATAIVRDDSAELWTTYQFQSMTPYWVAAITGLRPDQIIFYNQWCGGSFGHRGENGYIRSAVEVANQMRGTPVKLTYSREEDFAQDYPRQIAIGRNRGVVSEGEIGALDLHVASVSISKSQFVGRMGFPDMGPDSQIPQGLWNMAYAIPNFRTSAYAVDGLSPCSSWRSVGASTGGFFAESFIDELIHEAGRDPLQARIEMCQVDYFRKALEAAGEMSNWKGPLGEGRGRGVALVESFGCPVVEIVEVTATDRGIRLDNVWVVADVGRVIDPVNIENQIQGGVIWGLGHAMNSEITYAGGMAKQTNYHAHMAMRLYQCPEIEVRVLENNPNVTGIGEPTVPPAAPALANAIFAATGKRIREMPFDKFVDFI